MLINATLRHFRALTQVERKSFLFLIFFCGDKSPFCGASGNLVLFRTSELFRTLLDSAHEFQSQGGSIIAYTLLSLAQNDPQSQL